MSNTTEYILTETIAKRILTYRRKRFDESVNENLCSWKWPIELKDEVFCRVCMKKIRIGSRVIGRQSRATAMNHTFHKKCARKVNII